MQTVQVGCPNWDGMDVRPILNTGRLVLILMFIIFVIFSRTSMLRDNPLSGILG